MLLTEPVVIAVRLAGLAVITCAWIGALHHKEIRMSKIPLFSFIERLFSKKAAPAASASAPAVASKPATTAAIAAKAGVSSGSIIPVLVQDAGKLAASIESSTTVAALTTKLDSLVSDLESHVKTKLEEVATHAKAEAASLEAKLAASKEAQSAKDLIGRISDILKAPAIAEAKASDAAGKVSALLASAAAPSSGVAQPAPGSNPSEAPLLSVPGVPVAPATPATPAPASSAPASSAPEPVVPPVATPAAA